MNRIVPIVRLFTILLIASLLVCACSDKGRDELANVEQVENEQARGLEEETFTKKIELHDENVVEAKVTYYPGLKLAIGDEEVVVSENVFASLDPSQQLKIDLNVTDQDGRTNKIIILSAEMSDSTYGSRLLLWGFEYHNSEKTLKQIWELERDPIEVDYSLLKVGDRYELEVGTGQYSERIIIDELVGQHEIGEIAQGLLELSPPIDYLLEDYRSEEKKDVIVRRQLIGEKPKWLEYDYMLQIFTVKNGDVTLVGLHGSNDENLYSRKDIFPTYTASYDKVYTDEPYLHIFDVNTLEQTQFEAPLAAQIHIAKDWRDDKKKIFLASDEGAQLMDIFTGELQPLPFTVEPESYSSSWYFLNFPDQFFETTNFAVENMTTLFRYDRDGRKTPIWETTSNSPVYGFSVSPDGKKIAILYSADEFIGAYSNLLVLDSDGNELSFVEKAGYRNKSDGVIPNISIEWTDEHTFQFPTELFIRGEFKEGIKMFTIQDDFTVEIEEVVHDEQYSETSYYPSPMEEYVIEIHTNLIVLVDQQSGERVTLGSGHFLGWLDEKRAAWYTSHQEGYPEPHFTF